MKKVIVTTSWDDVHKLNLKLVELLNKFNLKGTFYIALDNNNYYENRNELEEEIREISQSQEIGAHTLTHPTLTEINLNQAKKEIADSKKWLEDLLSQPIKMFSYPRGIYNDEIKNLVKKAGFIGARTVKIFNCQCPDDFFAWLPTLQIYPHPFRRRDAKTLHWSRHLLDPLKQRLPGLVKWHLPPFAYFNWFALARATFDYVKKEGGIWHLWGHSWEIERYQMWNDLEKIFSYINNFKEIEFLTNSQVLERCKNIKYAR